MDMAKRIQDLTVELTNILGVVGSPEENDVVDYVFNWFMELDYFKENPDNLKFIDVIDDAAGRKSVVATINGKKGNAKKTLVFIGHTDTVGISDYGDMKEFATKPFELTSKLKEVTLSKEAKEDLESGNYLFGRGIFDMKFGVAALMVMMEELGISLIYARSPQAKGKVERLWNTLQSRLPTDFKIAGITTVEQANEFLRDYIASFNSKFSVEPEDPISAYIQLPDYLNLDHILCVKFDRVTDNSSVFSIHNKHFMIVGSPELPEVSKKSKINVIISTSAGIKVEYQGNVYDTINYIKPKKSNTSKGKSKTKYIPLDDHYFKYGSDKFKKLYFDESYEEVLAILQEIFLRKYA